ncbi:MAG TPA: UDP-N-acetylmuramate dehydrogenase [Dehalococcoidia bacterium]|jgi:UDP-N-acetylmuramate dehydrogenase
MNAELVSELRKVAPVKLNEPMARHTTFGVGGPTDIFLAVKTEEQLRMSFAISRRHNVDVFTFGSGSNILVGDAGIRGVVIENQNNEVIGPERNGDGYKIRVGSGMSFAALARRLASGGFAGIEWACGIPGSMGGAVVSNAGAYGHSLRDVLVGARLTDSRGEIIEMTPGELALGYRNSAFTHGKLKEEIVLTVDLRVQAGDPEQLKERVRQLDQQRRGAQPPGRNCGSVFQNPAERSAWQYIDDVGLREHRIGNAQFSKQHSNFIQNLGGATAADVRALITLAQERVRERFSVELIPEVMFIGEFE